ncbi:ClpP/crotonase-like domain-containing protein [Hyaloraphidium curvatum]|nr:ClpP/crotonase-like domain-containing protein [Hyaloraphidium curvatum]
MPTADAELAKAAIAYPPVPNAALAALTQVKYETPASHPHLAVISLNRPKVANTISRTMTNELDLAFLAAAQDPAVRVIVLRGEGRHFSSGHDLGTPEQMSDPHWNALSTSGFRGDFEKFSSLDVEAVLRWRSIGKIVVAAVKGFVVYHGCSLAAIADIVIAADDLKYMPTMVQAFMLPWDLALNAKKVKEIVLTKRIVEAREAEELGIVNRVVPTGTEDAEAFRIADLIAENTDPFQARMMKMGVNQAQDAAGLTAHVRGNLGVYGSYSASRFDPGATVDYAKAMAEKKLAPIPNALKEETYYWTRTAPRDAAGHRGKAKI